MTPRSDTAAVPSELDEDGRRARLVVHLAQLVRSGAEIVEEGPGRALVVITRRESLVPNVLIAVAGIGFYLWASEPFFLLGAAVALLGWHRKLVAGAQRVHLLVRVDERGEISELVMETAAA